MGIGAWTLHFIAMLASKLQVPVRYDFLITLLSTVPTILAGGPALCLVSRTTLGIRRLLVGGTCMYRRHALQRYGGDAPGCDYSFLTA
jgi:NO-binding membrane sensor protein with MHYT domain